MVERFVRKITYEKETLRIKDNSNIDFIVY